LAHTGHRLALAIDLHRWLESDAATDETERLRRDVAIASTVQSSENASAGSEVEQIESWWSVINQQYPNDEPSLGEQVSRARGRLTPLVLVVGLLVGWMAAAISLSYAGDTPVNLLSLSVVFLWIPSLLLCVSLLALLLNQLGIARLSEGLRLVGPVHWVVNGWQALVNRRLGFQFGGDAEAVANLMQWQLMVLSQWLAIGFFLGASGALLFTIAVSDVAFGWSSTLEIEASQVFRWVTYLSSPWSGFIPSAVPTLDLVEASRVYRLDGVEFGLAAELGRWWQFVLAVMLVWGLLPRIVVLVLSSFQLQHATRQFLREHVEVTALLRRLQSLDAVAFVQAPEGDTASLPRDNADSATLSSPHTDGMPTHVQWDAYLAFNGAEGGSESTHTVSSAQSSADQEAVIAELGNECHSVGIFVKSWEPPVLEFFDFLRRVRRHVGASATIGVLPVPLRNELDERDIRIWQRALRMHVQEGGARTYVHVDVASKSVQAPTP